MNLFKRHSGQAQMQQKLDRDKTPCGAVEQLASEEARTKSDEMRPLFASASEQEPVFNIDFLCGWVKP